MKIMNLRILGLAIVLAGTFSISAKASLIDFDFSFTADSGIGITPPNSTDLTVTGEIIGLDYNGGFDTSAPTEIIITSVPSYFSSIPIGTPFAGSSGGTFTVDPTGQIVAADAYYSFAFSPHTAPNDEHVQFNDGGTNELWQSSSLHIYNSDGLGGTTYTLTSAVPEPSQYGMGIFLAVAGFIGWRRFSSRKAPAV